jgi:hypothetical protein
MIIVMYVPTVSHVKVSPLYWYTYRVINISRTSVTIVAVTKEAIIEGGDC